MNAKPWGKFRSFFWPIHRFELKRIIPMLLLYFFFAFTYMLMKDTKEPLLITAQGSGAEAIPFLKMWGTLPLALIFMVIYSKLSNLVSKKTLFYSVVGFFIGFFALFGFVLYPMRDVLHPTQFADFLQNTLPEGFLGPIALIRNWTFALYYSMCELWGSVGLSLLFWGFANDITNIKESKRHYSLFALGSSVAMFFSGPVIVALAGFRKKLPAGTDTWGVTLQCIVGIIMVCGLIIMGIYRWINRHVLDCEAAKETAIKKQKPKMSVKEAFSYLLKSRYLLLLATLVIGYAIANSYIEVFWKSQLKLCFPDPNDYSAFRGVYSFCVSLTTLGMLFFAGSNIIRKFGWKAAAMVTPLVVGIFGTGFFLFVIFQEQLSAVMGASAMMIAVIIGSVPNLLCKACKYSLFEPTKEMAYIPLDDEQKTKGKAAIDVLLAKFGKAGGAFFLQGLILFFGSLTGAVQSVAVILLAVIAFWLIAITFLNKRFLSVTEEQNSLGEAAGQ